MVDNNWIYAGVFLDDNTKNELMELVGDKIPEGWKVYLDHMTMVYNDHTPEAQAFYEGIKDLIGTEQKLVLASLGMSDKAMALGIKVNALSKNANPHITVATSPTGKPVDSNYIKEWKVMPLPTVKGIVGVVRPRNN